MRADYGGPAEGRTEGIALSGLNWFTKHHNKRDVSRDRATPHNDY